MTELEKTLQTSQSEITKLNNEKSELESTIADLNNQLEDSRNEISSVIDRANQEI